MRVRTGDAWALAFFVIFFSATGFAKDDKAPSDLSIEYEFVQGGPEKGATIETYKLSGNTLTRVTDYIPTQYGSDASKRTKETKSYTFSKEKLDALWQTIQTSDFLNWSSASPQRPPQSGNQTVTVKGGGKSATHSMWEPPNKERFIEFSTDFLNWARGVITIEY
jgi:hypothetical protein